MLDFALLVGAMIVLFSASNLIIVVVYAERLNEPMKVLLILGIAAVVGFLAEFLSELMP